MNMHKNARLTVHSRALMVRRVLDEGRVPKSVATDFGVSERTVYKWIGRYRQEGVAGLSDRPSAARRLAHKLPEPWVAMILRLRREYRLTAQEISERLAVARSTVSAVLARHEIGRVKFLKPPEPARRYEHKAPGDMIHLDVKKLVRFWRVGHRITSDRHNGSTAPDGTSFTSASTTIPASPMSRSWTTRSAAPRRLSWSGRCAGSR